MMKKESFDDLMTQQQSLQHLDDPDSLLLRSVRVER